MVAANQTLDKTFSKYNHTLLFFIYSFSDSNGLRYFIYNGGEPRLIAPAKFYGDLRLSYGQQLVLEFVLQYDPTLPSDSMFVRYD